VVHNLQEQSYEYKMKNVLTDLKAKPSIRGGKDWDLTQKVCREGSKIVESIIRKNELSEETGNYLKPKDCHAPIDYRVCRKYIRTVFQ
jgi:hypothetical protein